MRWWTAWLRQPQSLWLRRALFQAHLWIGLALGVYVLAIFVSGSVLVYRNELYRAFLPAPGQPLPLGYRATTWLLNLHANLLAADDGRRLNGALSALVALLTLTGVVVWWPGVQRWRRSLAVDIRARWRQLNWSVHSAFGIWCAPFLLMWAVTGMYLAHPQPFTDIVDYFEPPDDASPVERVGDRVLYWLGYAHFGRFGGRVPGCVRDAACDWAFKTAWAAIGLVPVLMLATGVVMWWNRSRYGAARWRARGGQ